MNQTPPIKCKKLTKEKTMIKKTLALLVVFTLVLISGLSAAELGINKGDIAPDFILETLSGEKHSLSDYKGKQNVLLVFWASWCPPCMREIPDLIEIENKYSDKGLKILAVNVTTSDRLSKVKSTIKQKKINYTVLLDQTGEIATTYQVRGIPTNIIVDKEGVIKYRSYAIPHDIEEYISK